MINRKWSTDILNVNWTRRNVECAH